MLSDFFKKISLVAVGNSIFNVIHWHQEATFPLQE